MKSIKLLLATLVISGFFASCAKEEMTVVPENQNDEFVGAALIGKGVSVNFGMGTQTKISANGEWEKSDKLGLGWIVASNPFDVQDPANGAWAPEYVNKLYANHMFQKSEEGKMTTKGNVYEGWHFGYYPFNYMDKLGEALDIQSNPVQTLKDADLDRYNNRLYLSAREFLTKEKNLDGNLQLTGVQYDMHPVFKTISVIVKPESTFTESDVLKGLAIKSIKADVGANNGAFSVDVKVNPSKLATVKYDEDNNYDAAKTKEQLYGSFPQAVTTTGHHSEITTTVDNKEINLSGDQALRIYTLPLLNNNLNMKSVVFTVRVEGGVFTVSYVDKAENLLKDYEKTNNAAMKELVEAYKTNGALSAYNFNTEGEYREGISLVLDLDADLFKPDFTAIRSEEEWNTAVKVADVLGMTEATFTIAKTNATNPANWSFKDVDGDGNLVNLPKAALTVDGEPMILAANGVWPAKGIAAHEVVVNSGITLTVNDNVLLNSAVINKGIISVGKKATVKTVNNAEGRINVVYGSYLEMATSTDHGVIAYNVTGNDMAYQINYLTHAGNALGDARVNTLVVNDKTFNLSMVDFDVEDNDPYNGHVTPGKSLIDMNTITFELNNGVIKADANSGEVVKAVKVLGGTENAIWNTNVKENLTIVAGKVTVDAAKVGTYKESLKVEGTIDNKAGELVANADVYTTTIKNPAGATTTVATGSTVWYKETYVQGGTASGNITKLAGLPGVFVSVAVPESAIQPNSSSDPAAAKANAQYVVDMIKSSSFQDGSTIVLPAGTYHFTQLSGNSQFDGKSFTLVGTEGTVVALDEKGIKVKGTATNNVTVTMKNLTIDANGSYGVYVKEYATVNLQDVTIKNTGDMSILVENASAGVVNTSVLNAYNVNVPTTSKINLCALPCTTVTSTKVSKIYVNYAGGNITAAQIVPQDIAKSTGDNMFINGVAIPEAN